MTRRVVRGPVALVLGFLVLLLAACSSTTSAAPPANPVTGENGRPFPTLPNPLAALRGTSTPLAKNPAGVPAFSHIYIIVMENKEYGSVIGGDEAPYINSLASQYALATDYTAVSHPSEPNYLALFSGSTQGAIGDGVYNLGGENLADQIEKAGKKWNVFAQNYPLNCFKGTVASGGADGAGTYARKHNPAMSFTDISGSSSRCANFTDLKHFDANAANYELIVPNLCNDMHDCSVATGDKFLQGFVPQILKSGSWQNGGVLFIVWDEGTSGRGGGGQVPLLVISSAVKQGYRSTVPHNHYSLVRTIEDAWGMRCLNLACRADNLGDMFP